MTGGGAALGRRVGRRLIAAALAVLVGVLGAMVLYQTSLQPGAMLVAWVFNRNQLVTPPAGFSRLARSVTEQRVAIPTLDAPTAHLDILPVPQARPEQRHPWRIRNRSGR